jgi:hypothetical protein
VRVLHLGVSASAAFACDQGFDREDAKVVPDTSGISTLWFPLPLTYVFLLRLPSEALPARKGSGNGQSRLSLTNDTLVLLLHRRSVVGILPSCSSGRGHVRLQEEQTARQQANS